MTSKLKDWSVKAGAVAKSPAWRRRAALVLGGLLLFWALAWALVPIIAKSQIEKIASTKLGRTVTVSAVEFKPWSLELAVYDLKIARQNSSDAQLSIRRLYIDAELESLLRLAPVVDAVAVDSPQVSLTHLGGGRYDIDDILDKLKSPADAKPGEPLRFALYNLSLSGGQVSFSDKAVGKNHELTALSLSVPFLSNLQSKRDVKTAPRLAFKLGTLDGPARSNFDSAAEGTPFAQTHKTDATFKLSNFHLAPYLGYLPASLPYKLSGAVINADVKVSFEQNPGAVLRVSGVVTADKVRLKDRPGKDLLGFDQLKISMDDVRPLARMVKLSAIELTNPALNISRDRAGRLNLTPVAETIAPESGAARARIQGATGQNESQKEAKNAQNSWKVDIANIAVRGGTVNWLDETLAKPADVKLAAVILDASKIAIPFAADAPLAFSGSMALAASATTPATINFSGTATDQAASVSTTVAAWPLTMAAKYVGQFLLPALGGQLDAKLGVTWQAAGNAKPQAVRITAPQVSLSDVLLAEGKVSLVSVKRVQVDGADIDLTGQSFKAAKLQVIQPKALVSRDADKRWMFERWLVVNKSQAPAPAPTTEATKANAPTWAVAIDEVSLASGAMQFVDKAGSKPVAFDVNAVNAQLNNLVLDDKSSAKSVAARLMPLSASLRLTAGRFEPGKLNFKGNLGLTPVQVQGQLMAERLPVQAFEPYFADLLNIELLRADASFKGKVAYKQTPAGPSVQVTGDAALEELKANTLAPSEDLLDWKALNLRGLGVALEPGKPTRVDVQETVLTDFFARLIVQADGRINLQDLVKASGSANATTSTVASATAIAMNTGAARAQEQGGTASNGTQKALSTVVSGTSSTASASTSANAAIINFGPVSLINGRVAFSDRFVKPNYSANLSDLTGKLSAFSSVSTGGTPTLADLELRGRAEGTASLEILGKLNPLAKPLALDITGKVRDLELPPLSPYAIKYSGYGITRGKMSVDVNYLVQPDGKLTAKNKLVLNQLSFGDRVEGSTASLPVKLAVALLADRNGVIDLDLPISGSLNDPQFSIGPIIIKVIVNVIVKAITAPFSLLAAAFGGGGDELGTVAFPSGSAVLGIEAKAGLDKVAKALTDRPSLKLTVVGTSNLDAEREGYKRARLDDLVRAEKRRSVATSGGTATALVSISAAEYPALLKEVYKRADITKPRSVIGLAKDLAVDDMEKLLLADIKVNDDAMQALALQRGVAVKEYLASKDLPLKRLFLGAVNLGKPDTKAEPKPDSKWLPRADLNIAM